MVVRALAIGDTLAISRPTRPVQPTQGVAGERGPAKNAQPEYLKRTTKFRSMTLRRVHPRIDGPAVKGTLVCDAYELPTYEID
jgi:hypothetical protein